MLKTVSLLSPQQEIETKIIRKLTQERPAIADKPARRLRNDCTVYVTVVEL